ncbi:MAG: O-antigen ligase family protein [Halioglobus sp.]|nr:O-antigen ligase family protein [Halioglobus sp.]
MTISDNIRRVFPFLLLTAYGIFTCSYFIFPEYSDPYRFFARVVFALGVFVFFSSTKQLWGHLPFKAIVAYLCYLLLSGFWSDPFEWFLLGQKFTIAVYILCFIAITHYLVHWNSALYERMLQTCILFAALAATVSLVCFYREHEFPSQRLMPMGSLTNINEFSNVYGILAILAMGFALKVHKLQHKTPFLLAVAVFIAIAWFGQSRTAFTSLIIALVLTGDLVLNKRKGLYVVALIVLAGSLVLIFPDVIEQAILRGQGLRPLIWSTAWDQALTAPLLGHGLISPVAIHVDGRAFATIHNAYLQIFWIAGSVGVLLFLVLLVVAFRSAWIWGRQHQDFTIFSMLLFATCVMTTGVDTLIDRPRDQWMLFWFPLALLLAYQSLSPRLLPGSTRGAHAASDKSSGNPA